MRGILSKFTKRIVIEQYFTVLNPYCTIKAVDALKGYFHRNDCRDLLIKNSSFIDNNYIKIVLTEHAFQRWNQRVACSHDQNDLENKLNILHFPFGRVELINREIGLIDREILFTYERDNDNIVISTIYGRLSENPSLYQFETMRSYNFSNDDYILLSLEASALQSHFEPPIPTQRMVFRGNTSRYLIDKYSDLERSLFILLVLDGSEKVTLREIFSDQPSCEKIEKSALQALMLLGHENFVYEHVAYHHPEELARRIDKMNNRENK